MDPGLVSAVEDAIAWAVGGVVRLTDVRSLGGGCINAAAAITTSAGPFFVKWNARPLPHMFAREAEGLARLAESGAPLRIPRPVAHRPVDGDVPGFLVTELLEPGRRGSDFDVRLGEGLAAMHRAGPSADEGARYGFPHDNYCGSTPQPNGWMTRWVDFYRERRLGHQLRLAVEGPGVPSGDRRAYERMLERLDDLLADDDARPALIHGDLWSGNLHVAPDGQPALIDPAAYFGHREAELGMMALFGGFSPRVWAAYEAAWPLAPGWRDRLPLYELYHVMNHYNLFGGGYGAQAFRIARRYGG